MIPQLSVAMEHGLANLANVCDVISGQFVHVICRDVSLQNRIVHLQQHRTSIYNEEKKNIFKP